MRLNQELYSSFSVGTTSRLTYSSSDSKRNPWSVSILSGTDSGVLYGIRANVSYS